MLMTLVADGSILDMPAKYVTGIVEHVEEVQPSAEERRAAISNGSLPEISYRKTGYTTVQFLPEIVNRNDESGVVVRESVAELSIQRYHELGMSATAGYIREKLQQPQADTRPQCDGCGARDRGLKEIDTGDRVFNFCGDCLLIHENKA